MHDITANSYDSYACAVDEVRSTMNFEYALKNKRLVHIAEVERGLKCDCFCPCCKDRMVAKKGKKVRHHFAHQNEECKYSFETVLHYMAKEILETEMKIQLPIVQLPKLMQLLFLGHDHPLEVEPHVLSDEKTITFDDVILEKRFHEIIPDVLIITRKKQLIIEIRVTHEVDDTKLRKIKSCGISALEIDLSNINRAVTYDELKEILISDSKNKKWIYNHKATELEEEWLKLYKPIKKSTRVNEKGYGFIYEIKNCPLKVRSWKGNHYANINLDCRNCPYYLSNEFISLFDSNYHNYCCGESRIASIQDLIKFLTAKK